MEEKRDKESMDKDNELKRDFTKVDGLVELLNKPPHLWTDEEVLFATRMMK
jgi:hypothetical protein